VLPVTIIDGGGANIASLRFALERLGASSELTADPEKIRTAERVILPGVGAADDAMRRLRIQGLDELIPQLTQPLLGICLGMQLLFDASDEDSADCLGIIPGHASLFEVAPEQPVPHMGWNRVNKLTDAPLLDGIPDGEYFYFVHSYALDEGPDTIGSCDYGRTFTAIVQQNNFMGAQFHPERSGKYGAQLLQNFLQLST
jgi:glutamine amidotransferase